MGLIQPHELSLGCKSSLKIVSRTVSDFLGQVSLIGNIKERISKLDEYSNRLGDEMRKIEAFKRELPLSMLLLNDAIMAVMEEANDCRKLNAKQVWKEFIPLKKPCDEDDNKPDYKKVKDKTERMNWMSSVQLWNGDPNCSSLESSKSPTTKRAEEKLNNGSFKSYVSQAKAIGFVPFKGYNGLPMMPVRKEEKVEFTVAPGLSLGTPGTKKPSDEIISNGLGLEISCNKIDSSFETNNQSSLCNGADTNRKQRRCWSPDLHRLFVDALQQLGGSQVATPRQIREIMQVDGLTNDEVKSHLQKYRLHTRRLSTTKDSESSKRNNIQSGSPEGPLYYGGASRGSNMTVGDSIEDEDDGKSESHSWRNHIRASRINSV